MSSANKHLKKYSPDFKLKVVLKYLSEQITIAQICSEFNVSKSTLSKWVTQFKLIVETYLMMRIRQRTTIKPITKITKKLQRKKSPTFTPR
jgi:transposase